MTNESDNTNPSQATETAASKARPAASHERFYLVLLGILSSLLYGYLSYLSFEFKYVPTEDPDLWEKLQQRPILWACSIYFLLFSLYLVALGVLGKLQAQIQQTLWLIVGFGILFRVLSLCSVPIQEIDIYRYVWDGKVTVSGYNPYSFSPEQVRGSEYANQPDLLALREIAAKHGGLHDVVQRIHMEDTCTIYPPVSQLVFAVAVASTPSTASAFQFMLVMKLWLLLFDIATIFLVVRLLVLCGRSPLWVTAYAWCPLVLKEFANGGHLDSIAICLSTLAVVLVVTALRSKKSLIRLNWFVAAGVAISFAIGAKIYPVVLMPIFAVVVYRSIDWRWATGVGLGVVMLSSVLLLPQLLSPPQSAVIRTTNGDSVENGEDDETNAAEDANDSNGEAKAGLTQFANAFEMNDFLFMLVYEHLHPRRDLPANRRPWFVTNTPEAREGLVQPVGRQLNLSNGEAAFLLARVLTLSVLLLIIIYLSLRLDLNNPGDVAQAVFLTLAWFWLLSPTQNPWYLCWALPFLPFARSRVWYLLSGLTLIYYTRFYFNYHFSETVVWPATSALPAGDVSPIHLYYGDDFFYLIVVVLEFGPWLILLFGETVWRFACDRLNNNRAGEAEF